MRRNVDATARSLRDIPTMLGVAGHSVGLAVRDGTGCAPQGTGTRRMEPAPARTKMGPRPTTWIAGNRLEGFRPLPAVHKAASDWRAVAFIGLADGPPSSLVSAGLYQLRCRPNLQRVGFRPPFSSNSDVRPPTAAARQGANNGEAGFPQVHRPTMFGTSTPMNSGAPEGRVALSRAQTCDTITHWLYRAG